jgi:hypothetical protein
MNLIKLDDIYKQFEKHFDITRKEVDEEAMRMPWRINRSLLYYRRQI